MSIVPKEVLQDIRETWPAREMGLLEYATERAAEWALNRAATIAAQTVCDTHTPTGVKIYGTRAAKAIRALISPEGKIKGGESDGRV
jgi:hypothetical protein